MIEDWTPNADTPSTTNYLTRLAEFQRHNATCAYTAAGGIERTSSTRKPVRFLSSSSFRFNASLTDFFPVLLFLFPAGHLASVRHQDQERLLRFTLLPPRRSRPSRFLGIRASSSTASREDYRSRRGSRFTARCRRYRSSDLFSASSPFSYVLEKSLADSLSHLPSAARPSTRILESSSRSATSLSSRRPSSPRSSSSSNPLTESQPREIVR